jgi:hypothetical protein
MRSNTLPVTPTSALPGTAEKILVLAERAQRREQLFHPADATEFSRPGRLPRNFGMGRPSDPRRHRRNRLRRWW